jgi:hypothetical protein
MSLPATLTDWIFLIGKLDPDRPLWTPLEAFFDESGYVLFQPQGSVSTYPKDKKVLRAPDEYHHWIPEAQWGPSLSWYQTWVSQGFPESAFVRDPDHAAHILRFSQRSVHVAARSHDGKDVIIRLIAKAGDGLDHLEILRKLSSPSLAADPANHALPLLGELAKDDMIFAIFPLVGDHTFDGPWFPNVAEVFEVLEQVLEVGCHCSFSLRRGFGC